MGYLPRSQKCKISDAVGQLTPFKTRSTPIFNSSDRAEKATRVTSCTSAAAFEPQRFCERGVFQRQMRTNSPRVR
jgi:hypothetical protein